MNSALKPVLASAAVPQPSGQASPAKANANHAPVGLPQGAQNSLNHGGGGPNSLNLTQPTAAPPPPHAPSPSMAPVTPNMAQMAQNMSHHGNLSHANSTPQAARAPSPGKVPSSSSPLSLVQDKPAPAPSQPLALTRTPEKKEPDSTGNQSNGTIDSPKSGSNAPTSLKPQNPETNKDKQDIAKTSPSTPKPPEKQSSAPNTPQKSEPANSVSQVDGPIQPKVATASEAPEKSPSKPMEPKPAPTAADVAPTQSDTKPVPEAAKDTASSSQTEKQSQPTSTKQDPEPSKAETCEKPEQKTEEPKKVDKPELTSESKTESKIIEKEPKKEEAPEKVKLEEKVDDKKEKGQEKEKEPKKEVKPKPTMKLATVTPPLRKRRQTSPAKGSEGPSSAKKSSEADTPTTPSSDTRTKRNRTKVQLYQSPTPEIAMATKLSASAGRSTPTKPNDDKLIVFYKNEYLAVRNAEGGFYVCQAMQNVYRTTRKIKIRWLSQDKTADPSGETYKPDFYDVTDMECVLTTLSLSRAGAGGGGQVLRAAEHARASSILQRALRAEQGASSPTLNPEHPDGLDLSLYTDESQLDKKSPRKRNASKSSPRTKQDTANETAKETATPAKKARTTPKRSPKSARKAKTPAKTQNNNKRKTLGSTPNVASTSKTATAVLEKAKETPKTSGTKRTAAKQNKVDKPETPVRKTPGRRSAAKVESAPSPATPSTSSGKTGRTPRKPPSRK